MPFLTFYLNSTYLNEPTHQKLHGLAKALKKHNYTSIRIEGHNYNTGTEDYNKWLSQRQAETVKAFLDGKGIPAGRMSTTGYGESAPLASNDTADGQARNRRVEVIISK